MNFVLIIYLVVGRVSFSLLECERFVGGLNQPTVSEGMIYIVNCFFLMFSIENSPQFAII